MKNIKYYDTHAHLNIDEFNIELEPLIEELKQDNVIMNCIAVDLETSLSSIELSLKYKGIVYPCVGIHPTDGWKYKGKVQETIDALEEIIINNKEKIVCIGEIGLDYYTTYKGSEIDKEFQKEIFKKQLDLAIKYDLPINIHNRESDDDLVEILKNYNLKKVMIHCFSSNLENAKRYIEMGYFLSIPGIVTFKNASSLHEAVKHIPLDRLVVETDTPFLTPVPFRGKPNQPNYVKYVVKEIAKLKNMDEEKVRVKLLNNSLEFFGINK